MDKHSARKPIRKLAFIVNRQKSGAPELAVALIQIARSSGVEVKETDEFPLPDDFLKGQDACCVIGGDGTLLSVVRQSALEQVPIIGVNRGSLGFLTTFSAVEAKRCFPALLEGEFALEFRALIECQTSPAHRDFALNDVLIKDAAGSSRLVRLEVFADDDLVTDYYCDGLIFSTPTGSTAYNLSAGGPIIHPRAEVIAMTPICPHTLSNRSVIFRHDVRLRIYNRMTASNLLVAMDGQRNLIEAAGSPIEVGLSQLKLPLVQKLDSSYFQVVRTKLKWSGGSQSAD